MSTISNLVVAFSLPLLATNIPYTNQNDNVVTIDDNSRVSAMVHAHISTNRARHELTKHTKHFSDISGCYSGTKHDLSLSVNQEDIDKVLADHNLCLEKKLAEQGVTYKIDMS